ncbi:hypothetical protein ACFFX0_02680 [Citricoccus parietis]|uniref:Uncharacterized protein n=1 Tax=Citricoccus parietis TaxID=592307 RepID=A0ABV5FU16_9MICC
MPRTRTGSFSALQGVRRPALRQAVKKEIFTGSRWRPYRVHALL